MGVKSDERDRSEWKERVGEEWEKRVRGEWESREAGASRRSLGGPPAFFVSGAKHADSGAELLSRKKFLRFENFPLRSGSFTRSMPTVLAWPFSCSLMKASGDARNFNALNV